MEKWGALDGIKVVDLTRLLPGPYCSMILADHGARVIAVEDAKYKAEGLFLSPLYRNKEHITLNLKSSQGKEIFFKLAKDADVVLEGFRPGVVDRLGVGYKDVSSVNPGVVYCSITGYGQAGPFRDRAGHDANYLSYSGVLNLIGAPDRPPSIPGVQIADIAGGGLYGALGVLLALFARQRTGKGQYVDISMTDGMVSLLPVAQMMYKLLGVIPQRSDSMLSHRYACYSTYETADNRFLSIGAVENRFWRRLCRLLGCEQYIELQYDESRRQEIHEHLKKTFRQKTLAQWEELLAGEDVCMAPIRNMAEVMQEPLFKAREMLVDLENEKGEKEAYLGTPIKLSQTPGGVRSPAVDFGGSTNKVLAELGYDEQQIRKMRDDGVI